MMIRADLHMHTCYSPDGEFTPAEMISLCRSEDLQVIAITDHNSTAATDEILDLCSLYPIRAIPGIEIDCNFEGIDLHLLGYNIHWKGPDFINLEHHVSQLMMDAFSGMIHNLKKLGMDVDEKEVLDCASGKPPTAELIAEVLLRDPASRGNALLEIYRPGGRRGDMPYINFYLDFFAQGKPAYVNIDFMKFSEAIDLVSSNGGIPVIAHPGLNFKGREEMVAQLIHQGARGLEVFNNYHSEEQIGYFAEIACKNKLVMTCGSDFHGKTKPLIKAGRYGTLDVYDRFVTEGIESLLI